MILQICDALRGNPEHRDAPGYLVPYFNPGSRDK